MEMVDGTWRCELCGAQLAVEPAHRVRPVTGSAGTTDVRALRVGGREIPRRSGPSRRPLLTHEHAVYAPISPSVTRARHFVESGLTGFGCRDSTVRDAALLVSELASNVVRHVESPFAVMLGLDDDRVTTEVADAGSSLPELREPDAYGGRGLLIVDEVATDWGVRRWLDGKTVYFTLPW